MGLGSTAQRVIERKFGMPLDELRDQLPTDFNPESAGYNIVNSSILQRVSGEDVNRKIDYLLSKN